MNVFKNKQEAKLSLR